MQTLKVSFGPSNKLSVWDTTVDFDNIDEQEQRMAAQAIAMYRLMSTETYQETPPMQMLAATQSNWHIMDPDAPVEKLVMTP